MFLFAIKNVMVHERSQPASACQKIFTWLGFFDHVIMQDLSLFIISFCDTQVLLLRPSWNPSRTNSSSFFANRFSSASFTTLSWLPFASLFLTVFFNIFFFSRILFGQRWTFILPLNFYGPKQKKQPCFWMIGDNC